jgi:hypothetical protein
MYLKFCTICLTLKVLKNFLLVNFNFFKKLFTKLNIIKTRILKINIF